MTDDLKKFKKFDAEKYRWHLLPLPAVLEVLKVLDDGAKKYGDFNWYDNSDQVEFSRLLNALDRHAYSFKLGQDFDSESGRYELAHMVCNLLFLLTMQIEKRGIDDRTKWGAAETATPTCPVVKQKTDRSYAP